MDEWIKKMWFIHTMEYYSALKKKGILGLPTLEPQREREAVGS